MCDFHNVTDRIDYLMHAGVGLKPTKIWAPNVPKVSDHLPVVADFELL
jgi:hypothetical protein